ncbi:ATP synthase subunit I [Butyrivibrio sp. MC2013]|uniref:ATP synthase subunit I n=1 Tax=Butyrivibrio sp. MC2013 TaxID=1280686 RepID=UPI00040DC408|nr:ATP synthase subunit I [Butyrivibrio sp. MC2013]
MSLHLDNDLKTFIKEVYIGSGILCVVEILALAAVSMTRIFKFDLTVVLGAVGGTLVAMLVFAWMAMSLQKSLDMAASGETQVRKGVQLGYGKRLLAQGVWIVFAIYAPFINTISALIPLLFPKAAIYLLQITGKLSLTRQSGAQGQSAGAKGGES